MRLEYKASGELHYDRNNDNKAMVARNIFIELCKETKLEVKFNSKRISFSGDPEEVSKAIKIVKNMVRSVS